jgi:hypothetical protein
MFSRPYSIVLSAPARWTAFAVAACGLLALGEIDGQRRAGQALVDYVSAQAQRTVVISRAQSRVVIQTEIKYRDRIKSVYLKGETIERQVPVYVTPGDDTSFGVNAGFVRIYNAAWSGDDPGPASDFDREPAGISLSEIAEADAHNATSCRAWREQALSWREFYANLKAITDAAGSAKSQI